MSERTLITVSNDPVLSRAKETTVTATTSFTAAQAGEGTYNVATDAIVMNLPEITDDTIGMEFNFRNTGADGAVLLSIDPASTDGINGTIANAAADAVASGVVGKKLNNTKATANKGDYVTLKAVALTKWFIVGGVGIWASEA